MNILWKFLFSGLTILLLIGCKDNQITYTYPDGKVSEQYQYIGDSLKHGEYKAFMEDGSLSEIAQYNNGKLDGVRKIYSKGVLTNTETYKDDVFDGPYKVYYPDGTVKLEMNYQGGAINGIVKGYYPSGAIKEEVTFEDNVENGPFIEYHENGVQMWKGTYLDGDNEFGLLEEFDDEGTLIKKMMCNELGVCTTTWKKEEQG